MRPRDLIVVGAIVLVAGFAAADALRGRAERVETAPSTKVVQTGPTRVPSPEPPQAAPADWPPNRLAGTLVFKNASDCRLREVQLSTGSERRLARFLGTCDLWAAPVGPALAYGLGPSSADGLVPFKLADVRAPDRELGGSRALFGVVLWSQDGGRVAWCGRRRVGFDLQIGGPSRRLPQCPAAYTPDGRIAYAVGNKLLVEEEVVHRANRGITYVQYGTDGSFALVIDGETLQRWEGDRLTGRLAIPRALQGRTPILRFDNCGVVFPPVEDPGSIELFSLGCMPDESRASFIGQDAAWSPDGAWLAVAGPRVISFVSTVGAGRSFTWPAAAAELAWRPD